jgi:hypothetical protein
MRAKDIIPEQGIKDPKTDMYNIPLGGGGGGGSGGIGGGSLGTGGAFPSFGTVGTTRAAGPGQTPPVAPTVGTAPAAANAAAKAAEANRVARQAQATQAAQSQMAPKPSAVPTTGGPAVFRRPEGRTAGGFDPSKSTSAQSDMERAKKYFGLNNPDKELVQAYTKARSSGQIPPQYTQTPSGQTPMAATKARQERELAKSQLLPRTVSGLAVGTGVGAGVGAYLGSKEQPATGTSTATPPPNDAWQAQSAPGQAAASKAAADALKKEPPKGATDIDEAGPLLIPALAGLGAAGLGGTAAYQMSKPSKPASVQPSSTSARPAVATTAPAARPASATTPPAARPAAATTARPAGGPQQGVVGSELARLSGGEFASRADRLNQARVDAILGSGYKAGSAAANLALRDYYKANPPMSDAQRQELTQRIFNQSMERLRQQAADAKVTVRPAGSDKSTETVPEDNNELTRLMKLSGQR